MKNWKIGTRIAAGFAAVIAIAIALGLFAYTLVGTIEKSSDEITLDALPGLYTVAQVENNVQRNLSLLLTLAASKDRQEETRIENEIQELRGKNTSFLADYEKTIVTVKGRERLWRFCT